ncbi:MAG: outer membrane protein assembly factor BamD [Gemmatimonadota bacterium]|jgi:outer membrane protein assembly factor BamD
MNRTARTTRHLLLTVPALFAAACGSVDPYQGMTAQELYELGLQRYEQGDWEDAIRPLERMLTSFGSSDLAPDARLLVAHANYGKGDFLTARSEYTRFLDRYSGSEDAPVAALGICRCLASLAPAPERDQSYTSDAVAVCRNVVVDYAGTPQAEEAADLANEMRLRLAASEFGVADFYFRRQLYDSAVKYYEFVVRLYPETEWAPKALLGLYLSNQAIGYDDLAEEAREQLLERYPDSPAAAEVRTDGAGV